MVNVEKVYHALLANGKLPKSECRITLFGRKNQSVCRTDLMNY
jgi:hypothetical protein